MGMEPLKSRVNRRSVLQRLFKTVAYLTMSCAVYAVHAGALDRSGQSIAPLFEDGDVFEYSQGFVRPDVSGQDSLTQPTGSVAKNFVILGAALKRVINKQYSAAVIVDQPWGADFAYAASSPLYGGTRAEADSLAISALLERRFVGGVSLYGGPRVQRFAGELQLNGSAFGALAGYSMKSEKGWQHGYIAGMAYTLPAYATRMTLTYSSRIEHRLDTTESIAAGTTTTKITTPQSVNLTFRTGVAAKTLLFTSVRWANWKKFDFSPEALGLTLAKFDEDVYSYTLGIGYRYSSKWSYALSLRHEAKADTSNSLFRPSNGYTGLVISGIFSTPKKAKLTVGLSYTRLGDAAAITAGGNSVRFSDSHNVALGFKLLIPL